MLERIDQKVDVVTISKQGQGIVVPIRLKWNQKIFTIRKIGLRHPVREGKTLYHIFTCTDGTMDFRLKYNTENLQWNLEEVSDGNPG